MRWKSLLAAALFGVLLVPVPGYAAATRAPSLVEAVKQGDARAVRDLLGRGAKANEVAPDGSTALFWAAYGNDLAMAELLLGAGANARAANQFGATALYVAAAHADADLAAKLLAAGADPNARLVSGETALMEAARQGKLALVQLLLEKRADPNARETNGGQTALMWAISERHAAIAEALVRHKADIHARSNSGFSALMFAAQQGDADSARLLLKAGAKPNEIMPKTGLTSLILASAMGHEAVAVLLLDAGADANAVDAKGFTPLHHAARDKGAVAIVKALLAHRADPDIRLRQSRLMADSGVAMEGATALALAAELNNLATVKALVDGGADPLIATAQNTTPLMLAAGAGTDLARPRSQEERATALETVGFLIEHGADVNAAGQFGWTALHAASYQGLNDVIGFLAAKGARLDTKDRFGQTALSIAYGIITKDIGDAYYQSPRVYRRDTAELLLKSGATPLERSGVIAAVRRLE
jgi:uncharacterized protein